ncbi:alpha/beta fold hydrolase [Methylopila musalis]|uniref:Alpha/beta fold hydrolase n=1 Tax=Methylopila musalis TaxID=1134781 RepID=A0ABW3Z6G1_9HYPH
MSLPATLDHRIAVAGGLTLHAREWRPETPVGAAVLCLPGLSRPLDDFTELAERLAAPDGGARRVIALSARGRGLSDRDPDPKRYDVAVETGDALATLDALGLTRVAVVGTSRGGLQAMMLAALKPAVLAAVVLNDVGPVVEAAGLARIRDYLAAASEPPQDWDEATERVAALMGPGFPALGRAEFERVARRTWRETADGLTPQSDPALIQTVTALDLTQPLPALWPLFDALANTPLMTVRGETSDILNRDTLAAMQARRPDMAAFETPGQGHAPQLADRPTLEAIRRFLDQAGA